MRRWQIRLQHGKYSVCETTNIEPHQYAAGVNIGDTKYYNHYDAKIACWQIRVDKLNCEKSKKKLESFRELHPEYFL